MTTSREGGRSEAKLEGSRLVLTYEIIKPKSNLNDQHEDTIIEIPANMNQLIIGGRYTFITPKKDVFILKLLVRNGNKKMSEHPRIVMTITRDGMTYDDVLIDFEFTKKESFDFSGGEIPKQAWIGIKKIIN